MGFFPPSLSLLLNFTVAFVARQSPSTSPSTSPDKMVVEREREKKKKGGRETAFSSTPPRSHLIAQGGKKKKKVLDAKRGDRGKRKGMCACLAGYHREKEGGVKKLYATTQFALWGKEGREMKEGENYHVQSSWKKSCAKKKQTGKICHK